MDNKVAIVVPSGPAKSRDRLNQALVSYTILDSKGYYPYIIATGFDQKSNMKDYLKSYGVPDSRIITESNATRTKENVIYSVDICRKMGIKTMYFATSFYQCKRLAGLMKRNIPKDWKVGLTYDKPEYGVGGLKFLSLRFVHELGSSIKEKLSGGEGNKVYNRMLELESKVFAPLGAG